MRDFLAATRDRVVVFDGGMGATLEQFDLDLERDYRLPGRCHEALVLNRPDVIKGVHESMVEAEPRSSRRHLPGLAPEARGVGPRRAHRRDQPPRGRDRPRGGRRGPLRRRLDRPDGFLPASDDPTLGGIRFRELVTVFAEQARASSTAAPTSS
jgi:5-methyltetrahydrofolate--homocysteine methyltransferase